MRRFTVALLLLTGLACGNSTGPTFGGRYLLDSYGSLPVPVRTRSHADGSFEDVAAGSLDVGVSSMSLTLVTETYWGNNTQRYPPATSVHALTYTRSGDALTIDFAHSETDFSGSVDGQSITIDNFFGDGKAMRFTK